MEPEVISTPPGISLLEPCMYKAAGLGLGAGFTCTPLGRRGWKGWGYLSGRAASRTLCFDGDGAAVGGAVLVGVVSDGVDTGLAVETRSWSSSAVPFPHEDLKHMVSDGGWPWGWVGGVPVGCWGVPPPVFLFTFSV